MKIIKIIINILRFIKKIFVSIYIYTRFNIIKFSPSDYLSIAAIMKNEGQYIVEWIEYHLLLGVSKFYIYDNESDDNTKELLTPYIEKDIVDYNYCEGIGKQHFAYKKILKKARTKTYWLAVIDLDEFIVPVLNQNLPEFLKEFEGLAGIEINWLIYGSGGKDKNEKGLVLERFKDHAKNDFYKNKYVKTILNPRFAYYIHCHISDYIFGKYSVNPNKEKISMHYLERNIIHLDKIRINHYYCKSHEEFLKKRARGRGTKNTIETRFNPMENFEIHDKNDIKNDPIMDKYIKQLYNNE